MRRLAIRVERLFTPEEVVLDAGVLIEAGRIVAVGRWDALDRGSAVEECDCRPLQATPGLVDLHIHGAGGRDFLEADAEALAAICRTVARHGTTALVATTMTAPLDALCRSLSALAAASRSPRIASPEEPAAQIVGIHLEGPFINPRRAGVHPPEWICAPSLPVLERLLEAGGGAIRLLTLAPEMDGALELIDRARAAGVVAAIGHTDATYEQAQTAIARGAAHAVHVFNAMRPFSHRETGVLGAVLTDDRVTAEVIADGVHVDRPALDLLFRAKGMDKVILVTDATAATGMPDGTYRLGPLTVTVTGGVCRDAHGRLAGSTLTLDRALRLVMELGVAAEQAIAMATALPAARAGLSGRKGRLVTGADADLVFFDRDWNVAGVMTCRMQRPAWFR